MRKREMLHYRFWRDLYWRLLGSDEDELLIGGTLVVTAWWTLSLISVILSLALEANVTMMPWSGISLFVSTAIFFLMRFEVLRYYRLTREERQQLG